MMTDEQINNFFVSIIPMLETIARGVCYKNNRNIDEHAAINETYLHIIKNKHKLNTTRDLQRMAVNHINLEIIRTQSSLNKKEGQTKNPKNVYGLDYDMEDHIDMSLEYKIEIEKWYNEKQVILQMYRMQETDREKQIIFDVYFKKGITKGVDMAKHLKINKDSASKYIREMKKDIKQYNHVVIQRDNRINDILKGKNNN